MTLTKFVQINLSYVTWYLISYLSLAPVFRNDLFSSPSRTFLVDWYIAMLTLQDGHL